MKSACFREDDLGIGEGDNILEREFLTLHIWDRYMNLSVCIPERVVFKKEEFYNDNNYRDCSYTIDMDGQMEKVIRLSSNQGGGIKEISGDYRYYLNMNDFKEVVYEIPEQRGYYFPNHNFMMWTKIDGGSRELQEYVKWIAQSVQFK